MNSLTKRWQIIGAACESIMHWVNELKDSPSMTLRITRGTDDKWECESTYHREKPTA